MNKTQSKFIVLACLLLFCVSWFYLLGARTLVPTDEGRYAEIAREMVVTHDWITPRLNGIKYFEKPPLQIWMTALAFQAFGLGEWQARLWTGLCGLLGIGLTAYAGRRLFDCRTGWYAGLVLASSLWWMALGHINTLDMGLAGMMTLTLMALLLGQQQGGSTRAQRRWMHWCWVGMALSVMSKGLIGVVLPGAVLILYTLYARDWGIVKRLQWRSGVCLFLAITVPWFALVAWHNPEFLQFFFIHEHFQRFTSKIHHRAGPWYYFIPILMLGSLPWLGVLAQSLRHALRRLEAPGFQSQKLLLVWVVFIFCFFSLSGSKLPSYILPIFPALALLIARYLPSASGKAWTFAAAVIGIAGIIGLGLALRLPGLTSEPLEIPYYQAAQPWALAASLVFLGGSALVLRWVKQAPHNLSDRATIALAITGFLGAQLAMLACEPLGRYRAGLTLVPAMQAQLTPATRLYAVGLYDQTLPFYLRRTMTLVQHPDELEFGLQQEPERWLPTREAFMTQWRTTEKAMAVTRPEIARELQNQGLPMRVIAQDARRVVISNDVSNHEQTP